MAIETDGRASAADALQEASITFNRVRDHVREAADDLFFARHRARTPRGATPHAVASNADLDKWRVRACEAVLAAAQREKDAAAVALDAAHAAYNVYLAANAA